MRTFRNPFHPHEMKFEIKDKIDFSQTPEVLFVQSDYEKIVFQIAGIRLPHVHVVVLDSVLLPRPQLQFMFNKNMECWGSMTPIAPEDMLKARTRLWAHILGLYPEAHFLYRDHFQNELSAIVDWSPAHIMHYRQMLADRRQHALETSINAVQNHEAFGQMIPVQRSDEAYT